MKRRDLGLLVGTSALALSGTGTRAFAQTTDASLLKTTLTPMGSERAGNAAGTIPAWSGGFTAIPADSTWDPTRTLPPDFFASDAMIYKVDASNMERYADQLTDGIMTLMRQKGFYVKVYPTRRTQAMPQWSYDQIALNVTRTKAATPGDYRNGFIGAYGGYPFPIPSSDPVAAAAQILWNNSSHWQGAYWQNTNAIMTNANGVPVLASAENVNYKYGLYIQTGSAETFNNEIYRVRVRQIAPANVAGGQAIGMQSSTPESYPTISWQVLAGQGRVRRTPNLLYDTPDGYDDGINGYDETNGFEGPYNRYDFKLIGKQEKLIPYNNNAVFSRTMQQMHQQDFWDPEYVRWELHRCWLVDATLRPGYRNVLAHRKFWIDEDTWTVSVTDAYDGGGNLAHMQYTTNANFPNLPGTIYACGVIYNLQTGAYVSTGGSYANPPQNAPWTFNVSPESEYDPTSMAGEAAY